MSQCQVILYNRGSVLSLNFILKPLFILPTSFHILYQDGYYDLRFKSGGVCEI